MLPTEPWLLDLGNPGAPGVGWGGLWGPLGDTWCLILVCTWISSGDFFNYEKLASLDTNNQKRYILTLRNANKAGLDGGRRTVVLTPPSIPTPAHPSGLTHTNTTSWFLLNPIFSMPIETSVISSSCLQLFNLKYVKPRKNCKKYTKIPRYPSHFLSFSICLEKFEN